LRFCPGRFNVVFNIHSAGCFVSNSFLRSSIYSLFLGCVACAVAPAGDAQSPAQAVASPSTNAAVEPWAAPDFSVDAKTLYETTSEVPVPDGANVVELVENESYTFDGAGRMTHVGRVVYKVLTQKGAEGWDSLSVGWEPWHEARPVIRARVITPDFSVHMLDPNTITEEPARGGDYKAYSDGKRVHAPFPAITPGVVVEEEYTETETEPLFAQGRVGRIDLGQENVTVAHTQAVFDAPITLPLRTEKLLLPDVNPVRTEVGGRVTLTYETGSIDGIDSREMYLPPDVVRYPAIAFATGASWQNVAAEYGKVVDSFSGSPDVKAVVDPLIAGKKSAAEKEAAIVDYLDREVRYTGIEFGEAAIMPHDPAETLAKKYGDCKDKATLLVTMLRAAGIPANVALLSVEARIDVPPDLPGMGMFDHAIVYVPGKDPIWIDATDRYAQLGQIPMGDQGRLALITSASTTVLMKTPESTSKDNGLKETREFTLTDNGPANVVEVTEPKGIYASGYRQYYADKPDSDTRDGLRGYVQAEYVSDDLTKVDRTDPADLSRPFELTIACEKAKRGYTNLENAQAAIRVDRLFQMLPDELKRKDDSDEKKDTGPDQQKKPRTDDWWLDAPYNIEWNYQLIPPAGFIPKELPKDATIQVGPAVLTEHFSTDKDGKVLAHFVFDTVKRRYTVAQATALRNEIADLIGGPAILVNFEPKGAALLREGEVKEALESYRALIALNPNAAVHHLQVANVLLEAGLGEAARAEARLAVKLDPTSALAERTLADILKHDLVGRNLRAGSDLVGAADAYRAAIKLDPDDHSAQGDLAILLEYDSVGRRYSGQSHMKEAIAEYAALGEDKLSDLGIADNQAFAMFYGGEYSDAYKAGQTLNPEPKPLLAASVAMMQDIKSGLAEANKQATDDASFKDTAGTAGEMLMNMREYSQAADFLQAGAAGDDAARTLGLANMLRGAIHHEDAKFANTPEDVVKRFALVPFDPNLTVDSFSALLSRNGVKVLKAMDADELKDELSSGKQMNSQLAREDSSLDVTEDILLQMLDPKGEGDDATGYREKVQLLTGTTMTVFVVKEDGQYKVLDSLDKPNSIALEILDRINAGDLKGAKALLDWMREDQHLEGGDDPMGGLVFPRFWTKGEAADARKMKLAAAAILVGTKPTVAQGVGIQEAGLKDAAGDRERTNIQLALAEGYSVQGNFAGLLSVAQDLLKEEPESKQAFLYNVQALMGLDRFDDASALADARLKLLDNDSDALTMHMEIAANRGDFAAAHTWGEKLLSLGQENAETLNGLAWDALFTGKVSDDDVATAVKATQLQKDSPDILHTLACLYAEMGKTKEAHDLLLRAMDDWNLDEPNDEVWYVLGRIAEQYGEREIAIADYDKLKKPKEILAIPTSTWRLAQMRLKAMGTNQIATGQ
jgi:tetratricopeptide (TPR) repeat protein/transglutaminase-like putative cysteine protease